jgi:RNA polymerase sigma-70 factor (ECF subfamily)
MWMTKLKVCAAALLAACLVAWGVGASLDSRAEGPVQEAAQGAAPATGGPAAKAADPKNDPAVSIKELPPVVVKAVPQSGETQVDAKTTTEIRVTFSKDMTDQSWSWSGLSKESYPKVTGKPHYEKDKRTCVLPVELEAGKTYALWINSEKYNNFKDADGKRAVPYLLVFETKP